MLREILNHIRAFPEYIFALQGALAILASGLPVYLGLRYFLARRKLAISWAGTLNFVSSFLLFAGLAFLLASPLASYMPGPVIRGYLFVTCVAAAMGIVMLIDVFGLQYYAVQVKHMYVSPPLRTVVKLAVFILAILPILRFVLHFDPLALVAIPTIATAGLALALQDTLKTFIAGIALGKMIRLGEWISYKEHDGRVIDMNWARTTIETIDGEVVYIPNSMLQTDMFLNHSSEGRANRQVFQISVAYDAPPARVKEILAASATGASNVLSDPPPKARVLEYGESGILYGLYYWVEEYAHRVPAYDDVATRVWETFKREGLVIPYPTRSVHLVPPVAPVLDKKQSKMSAE